VNLDRLCPDRVRAWGRHHSLPDGHAGRDRSGAEPSNDDGIRREPDRRRDAGVDGFSEADIRKVMGGNVLRVLRAGLAPM